LAQHEPTLIFVNQSHPKEQLMSAEERDYNAIAQDANGTRSTTGDGSSGAGAAVGNAQSAGNNTGSREDVIDALQDLVEACKDGEYGFRTSAERAERADLKPVLSKWAEEYRSAGEELNRQIETCGGTPEKGGSVMGAMHRGWVAVQAAIGDNDKAVLEGCERGQDNALARYRKALEKPLPGNIRSVVERQLETVRECHAQMKMLRDEARAA
jgi:uncharacterized protein (TIGR02284 family)